MFASPVALNGSGSAGSDTIHCLAPNAAEARDLVLLVEDDDTVAGLITVVLARGHHRVLRARTGSEGVRVFLENPTTIGLVILDCRLPDTDGTSLCRELRRRSPGLPVLLTSGRDHSDEVFEGEGATDFLPKPFRPAEVEAKVAALLRAID